MLTKNKTNAADLKVKYEPVNGEPVDPRFITVGKLRNIQNRLDRIEMFLDEMLVKIDYIYIKLKGND